MTARAWIGVLLVTSVAACAPAPPPTQGTSDDEVAMRGMAAKYAAAFNAADAAALAQMVSDDFEALGADGVHVKGRRAFQAEQEKQFKDRLALGLKLTLDAKAVYLTWIDVNHAVVGGSYTMAGLPAGAPDKGSWIVVNKRGADGKWVMTNSLVSEFVAPPPAEKKK
jgi:uncharacterized protein (TIGR02246 family)